MSKKANKRHRNRHTKGEKVREIENSHKSDLKRDSKAGETTTRYGRGGGGGGKEEKRK